MSDDLIREQDVLISFEQLTKTFKGMAKPALSALSGRIFTAEFTGLVGPDGAGKTTFMRLAAGLLRPNAGNIKVHIENVHEEIGYMPQKFGLYEDLSVQQNMNLYADLRGVPTAERPAIFEKLLDFTNLKPFTKRLAGALSGGMKQKLGLACALMKQPKLLLLDEPSVGVDPISRRELWTMVEALVDSGMGVVWSTAYLDEAEHCQRVLLLNDGELLFQGIPSDLTKEVKNRTFLLSTEITKKRNVLAKALNTPGILDGVIQGDRIRVLTDDTIKLTSTTFEETTSDVAITAVQPRFEDAFINRLGGGPKGSSVLVKKFNVLEKQTQPVIECKNLSKKFGDFTAARHIELRVKQGEIYGLLGPNGAGKSTTFKMLCGLLKPTEGEAHVTGIDLRKSASHARQRIGYMAQKFSLYNNLTVKQNLFFFSGIYGLSGRKQKIAMSEMISIFDLKAVLKLNAQELSLGFKQRLALACSLMHQPAVLFLDEPTSGVDPITRREFWNHINGLVTKNITVMVTTHFMDEVEYCDRMALIYRGEKIIEGTPDTLKEKVKSTTLPNPTMEDAFVTLIHEHDRLKQGASS